MDRVSESGESVVITKHGTAVAKLVPVETETREILGFMKGKARITGDIEDTASLSDWNLE